MSQLRGPRTTWKTVLLLAPFVLVPLTNTLPGLSVLFLAIGILQNIRPRAVQDAEGITWSCFGAATRSRRSSYTGSKPVPH